LLSIGRQPFQGWLEALPSAPQRDGWPRFCLLCCCGWRCFFAAWCSYFVLMAGLLIFVNARFSGPIVRSSITAIGLELLLSLTGAWFIARRSEGFRHRRLRLPFGAPFRFRGRRGATGSTSSDPNAGEWEEQARRESNEVLSPEIPAPPDNEQ
jgi:hypothetical protein